MVSVATGVGTFTEGAAATGRETGSEIGTVAGETRLPFPRLLRDKCLPWPYRDLPDIHKLLSRSPALPSPWMRFIIGAPDVLGGQMSINLRGRDIGMTQ